MIVKDYLDRDEMLIVNGDKPLMMIRVDDEIQVRDELNIEDVLNLEVKDTLLIRGVIKDTLRLTVR